MGVHVAPCYSPERRPPVFGRSLRPVCGGDSVSPDQLPGTEAMLYERLEGGEVQCHVCPRLCRISPGKSGVCRARHNAGGTLIAITYGRVCSVAADPIEKKPLYHFFPGSTVLSLGSVGCNFTCRHCQNWQIAHADPGEVARDLRELPVRNLPVLAAHNDCQGVAWTYNEPTIWLEYIL